MVGNPLEKISTWTLMIGIALCCSAYLMVNLDLEPSGEAAGNSLLLGIIGVLLIVTGISIMISNKRKQL